MQPRGGSSEGRSLPPKIYGSNFIHHDFVQIGKQHLRYKAIFLSVVLSQQYCEVYFDLSYSSDPVMTLVYQTLLKSPPLTLLVGSAP